MSELSKVKKIIIPNRDKQGWLHGTKEVVAVWECPVCKQEMGEPKWMRFCEDGEFYTVNVWTNQCGHIAKYSQLQLV